MRREGKHEKEGIGGTSLNLLVILQPKYTIFRNKFRVCLSLFCICCIIKLVKMPLSGNGVINSEDAVYLSC